MDVVYCSLQRMKVLNVDENIQDKGEFMFTFKNGNIVHVYKDA